MRRLLPRTKRGVNFSRVNVPPEPESFPLPKFRVLEGKELEETYDRMRQWLERHSEQEVKS